MDILEASGTVDYGSSKEYKDFIAKVKTLSPGTNPEDLKYITDRVDVDNYFDYMALEWFFGNSDAGNIRYYKLKGDGNKWRWIFYDSDYGMFNSAYNSPVSYMDPNGAGDQNVNNTLIRKLLENSDMRDEFLTRLGKVFQTFTTQAMLDTFNGLASRIEPEMPLHFARWAEFNEKSINADSPLTADGAMNYWKSRLNRSRNVIKKRPTLFYGMVQDYFNLSNATMVKYFGEKPAMPADALN
jgi:spore coat protein CotH